MRKRFLAAALLGCVLAGCGDDADGDSALPLVGDIGPAVEALEDELGGTQQYFEIHASPLVVTLWVSADEGRRAIPYVYAGGELADPEASQEASGFTFAGGDALTFDATTVLDQVEADLGGSTIVEFSIVGGERGAVRLGVVTESERGGQLDIRVSPNGDVLEAAPIDD